MTDQTSTETAATETSPARAFYGSDYGRLARIVRQVRSESGNDAADALAETMAAALATESPEFNAETFKASTYPVPRYVAELARTLRRARTGRDYQVKGDDAQATVNMLAAELAEALAQYVPGFSPERFIEGASVTVNETGDEE